MSFICALGYEPANRSPARRSEECFRSRRSGGYRIVSGVSGRYRFRMWMLAPFVLLFGLAMGLPADGVSVSASTVADDQAERRALASGRLHPADGEPGTGESAAYTRDARRFDDAATVEVRQGDTLWAIAGRHKPRHVNIRSYIDQIKRLNGLTSSVLYEGMLLKLPQ